MSESAATFKSRNAEYGDNWRMVGETMKALFPNGVTLRTADDHNRFHIFMLKIVKLSRYAINWEKGGHQDSIHDDGVYSAMLEMIDGEISEKRAAFAEGLKVKEPMVPPQTPFSALANMIAGMDLGADEAAKQTRQMNVREALNAMFGMDLGDNDRSGVTVFQKAEGGNFEIVFRSCENCNTPTTCGSVRSCKHIPIT